jgi:hypothetical protein
MSAWNVRLVLLVVALAMAAALAWASALDPANYGW